ncbi:MAG: DUF599 domain-containing protein [Hahellaceae bacterium]|nr:DUF599 domain-containing protein [Hahellaceae bacterium]
MAQSLDWFAFFIFALMWGGYASLASWLAGRRPCISNTLDLYREDWMRRVLRRENRIADTSVLGNLERNGAFFASSSLLIIAGILTALGYTEKAMETFSEMPFINHSSRLLWEIKLGVLLLIFVYAFFKFTWAMRQYNFCSVLVGSAPLPSEEKVSPAAREAFARSAAAVANLAGDTFNLGLRSYYFALAILTWFIHPLLLIFVSTVVVAILYHREFGSKALYAMRSGKQFQD